MCGIAGFIGLDRPEETQRNYLESMVQAILHRGPDEQGYHVAPPAALGHARLSIIDLSDGQQPMTDPSGRLTIVFNGEIYNYRELRAALEKKGHVFRTSSDTEVILHSYLEKGDSCVEDFEGMFSFAIWDSREQSLFAARDRMGKKPFYYTWQNGVFAFASELTALTRLDFLDFVVPRQAISSFLAYKHLPTPHTIYRDVWKLKPSHTLRFARGVISTNRYWDLPVPQRHSDLSEHECAERILHLADQATKRRLVSDVPLGAFLSGGLDSSAVVALMAKSMDTPVQTFSIGFKEKSYDESRFAQIVAETWGTDHRSKIVSALDAGSLLPEIIAAQDEPMADPSVLPTALLSQATREHVTVALSGDGGDELFGGYEHFIGFKWAERLRRFSFLSVPALKALRALMPATTGYVSPKNVINRLLTTVEAPSWLSIQTMLMACGPDLQRHMWMKPPLMLTNPDEMFSETRRIFEQIPAKTSMDRAYYLYFRQFLLDYILVKVDRCSMLHSLEVRAPLLDTDLVEFAFALPHRMKIKGSTRKYLFKKAFKDLLPRKIVNRKKRGFLIPTALWLKDQLRHEVDELLGVDYLTKQKIFKPAVILKMRQDHESGKKDLREELWTLFHLQLWLESHKPRLG